MINLWLEVTLTLTFKEKMPTQNTSIIFRKSIILLVSGSHRSCIDHFIISAILQGFVKSVSVLDSPACCSDIGHFPILITLKCNIYIYIKNDIEKGQEKKCKVAWHKMSNHDEFVKTMNHIISYSTDIYDLPSLQCTDRNCQDRTHRLDIDQVCTLLALQMCVFPPLISPCLK